MVALALSVFVCDESVVCVYAAQIKINLSHVVLILKLKQQEMEIQAP